RRIVMTNVGYDAMQAINASLGSVIGAEYRLLSERQRYAASVQQTSAALNIGAAILAALVVIIGIILLMSNVRRVVRTRDVLAESDERFRLLVDGVKDYGLYLLDPTGHVVSWNSGAEHLKGYRGEEIIGRHVACFFSEEDIRASVPDRNLKEAAEAGTLASEGWRLRKDGSRFWADTLLTALRNPDGTLRGVAKITRDVSERRRQQEALQQSQAALAQAPKMAVVGQLTGGVAHDFNNLLAAIQGSLDLLDRAGTRLTPERLDRLLRPARNAAARGAA